MDLSNIPTLADPRPNPLEPLAGIPNDQADRLAIDSEFRCMARLTPDAPAITQGKETLTYADLDNLVDKLASQIIEASQDKISRVVGIHGYRSATLVIAVLAAVRAGRTFAILDATYPADRLCKQAGIINPALILGAEVSGQDLGQIYGAATKAGMLSICLADLRRARLAKPCAQPVSRTAYLLFTSGTTGNPKCIATGHAPLPHFLKFYGQAFRPTPTDRFSMLSGVGHDPFLRDLFAPLSIGARLFIPDESIIRNHILLYGWLQENRISFIHATPQLLKLISAGQGKRPPLQNIKFAFSGGDTLLPAHIDQFRLVAPNAKLVNFYGATETPQAMGFYIVPSQHTEKRIPIGVGISDVQLLILSDNLNLAKTGELGQIGIRTQFLSDGYLGDAAASSTKYIVSPFTGDPRDRIYLTGDIGYYLPDGNIVAVGRRDDQVKIRGFRVELSEVNHAIDRTGLVSNSVVLPQVVSNGENSLIAYVVAWAPTKSPENWTDQFREALSRLVPSYMVPSRIVLLAEIPLTSNGKIDRQLLQELAKAHKAEKTEAVDANLTEGPLKDLLHAWSSILGTTALDLGRSFIQSGGDSLSFIQASLAVEEVLGWLPDGWEKMPLQALAALPRRENRASHTVGSPILVRALSIVLVVLGHFNIVQIAGSTTALFIIAGWSFGKYQLNSILERGSVRPLLVTAAQITVPVSLYTLLLQLKFSELHWESLLLVNNFIAPGFDKGFTYWFIDVLVQMFLLLAILFSFRSARDLIRIRPFAGAIGFVALTFVAGPHIGEMIWDTDGLFHRVPQYYLWTLFLGVAIIHADSNPRKLILSLITGCAWLSGQLTVFALLAALFVLWVPRLRVSRLLMVPVNYLAMASMFIYLTHFQFHSVLKHTPLGENDMARVAIALLGGILVWKAWETTRSRCMEMLAFCRSPFIGPFRNKEGERK